MTKQAQTMEYAHVPLGDEVEFLAGSYHIEQEQRIPHHGREVLYLVGRTSTITSCCGAAPPFSFIKVVGYVVGWRSHAGQGGVPVSQVELVRDEGEQAAVRAAIHERHPDIDLPHIEFW